MTRSVTVWDVADVVGELVATLRTDDVERVVARPLDQVAAHVDRRRPDVLHVVASDDGSDLPVFPGAGPAMVPPLWTVQAPDVVILDGCYDPESAERLRTSGAIAIGLPGRLGRGNADDFLRIWYASSASAPAEQAFDDALIGTGLLRLPDLVQPRLHHVERKGPEFSGTEGTDPRTVTVWYGTNRHPDADPAAMYTAEPDDELHTGRCDVRVPASVPVGGSRARRRRRGAEPTRYTILDHQRLSHDGFHNDLRAALGRNEVGDRSVLVYLHGYRTTFPEAATRAAQLHTDLNHLGHTAFFSWPSRGSVAGYFADEDAVQHAERHLLLFLTGLYHQVNAEQVNVVAHSMGNRALLRVAMRIAQTTGTDPARFGHILLAAADVDRRFFQAEATVYPAIADKVTSYVCARDKALKSSGIVHDGHRAGLTPPYTLVDGIDTIDASDIDLTLLSHGYYAAARPVLTDMHLLLRGAHEPDRRFGLERVTEQGDQVVWRIRP